MPENCCGKLLNFVSYYHLVAFQRGLAAREKKCRTFGWDVCAKVDPHQPNYRDARDPKIFAIPSSDYFVVQFNVAAAILVGYSIRVSSFSCVVVPIAESIGIPPPRSSLLILSSTRCLYSSIYPLSLSLSIT